MRPSREFENKRYYLLDDLALFIPGKGRHYEINGVDIAAFRFGDSVVAVGNRCPHEGGNLCDGRLQGCQVVCPRHGWKFDVETGERDLDPSEKILTFSTLTEEGIVWVHIPPKSPDA